MEIFENLPALVVYCVTGFFVILAILWFILPFVVISINDKMKKIQKSTMMLNDSILDLTDVIDTFRKESNINKLADKDIE